MSYSEDTGKYQKAYSFLYGKLVPQSGNAKNNLGEALRLVSKVYYRKNNDGDSYEDCIRMGIVPDFSKNIYPFDGEYHSLGNELDTLLSGGHYDRAISLVLFNIMLSLSSTTHIYNPSTNRLVEINTEAGRKALKELDIDTIFINYCGKNQEWLPEHLRKEGVKISKSLSEETKKELNCVTLQEFSKAQNGSNKKTMKLRMSHDNSILSKKFKKIESQHKKSVKADKKIMQERQKKYEMHKKRELTRKSKNLSEIKKYYESLKNMTVYTRTDTIKKMKDSQFPTNSLIPMVLQALLEYKEKKPTTQKQKENRHEVIASLVSLLNKVGEEITQSLDSNNTIWSYTTEPTAERKKQMDQILIKVLGSEAAVDELWNRCCRR